MKVQPGMVEIVVCPVVHGDTLCRQAIPIIHIPLSRKTPFPGGGDLPKPYYDAMDPFVVLAAAAQVHQDHQTRHRRGAHSTARSDPDRQAGRLD
jgi:hypothetical protein